MPSFKLAGQTIETDESDYLVDPNDWNNEVAKFLFQQEGINPTENHLIVVNFVREYFERYNTAPMLRTILEELNLNSNLFYNLFNGSNYQVNKIAGLPKGNQGC